MSEGNFKPGTYVGRGSDVLFPGDDVTYEIIVRDNGKCEVDCVPKNSWFQGGRPPWKVWGIYEDTGDEMTVTVTRNDLLGPAKGDDFKLGKGECKDPYFEGEKENAPNVKCLLQALGVKATEREFAKMPKWKKDGAKKKHYLF